ncbi:MAG: tetratricopeptide repeat protein [Planctomycetes bacterium]|nr:tetratricopeptide repeat protein [Planctomycetota bacterium]MBI3834717.1 tetratricopeptide repeat protein [Planctomycetota bacterium]
MSKLKTNISIRGHGEKQMFRLPCLAVGRFALIAAMLTTCGCQTINHDAAKKQATQRWSEVRARVKLQLANQQCVRGMFNDAATSAAEAIGLDPKLPGAYEVLAKSQLEQGKPASTEKTLDAAKAQNCQSAELHYLRGVVLELRDDTAGSLAEYQRAVELNPANSDYLISLAECLVNAKRADEALTLLDERADHLDAAAGVFALAAHIAELKGDREGAITRYQRTLALVPDHALIHEQLASLLMKESRFEDAIGLLKPLAKNDAPNAASARKLLAACDLAIDDPVSAKTLLVDYARSHPEDDSALTLLARASLQTHDLMTAGWTIDQLHRKHPDSTDPALLYASLLWQRGDAQAAETVLRHQLDIDPNNPATLCLLVTVLQTTKDHAAAQRYFEEAASIDPSCISAISASATSSKRKD